MNKALLTQQGHNLFCISRNKKALEELRDECSRLYPGAGINILGFDVTQIVNDSDILPASIKKLFHGLRAQIF